MEEQNQDRITNSTWITRGDSAGLFNAKSETAFTQSVSPAGTRWAFSGLNGNPVDPDFSAANYANLTFSPWRESLGGMGSLQTNIVNRPGVIHIVAEDIYVDILFSEWGSGGGGSFSYSRGSEPAAVPVESIPIAPVWVGACLLLFTAIAAAANRTYGA
ncbi:MAG: hypothetical protein KJP25_13245 [Gammaproteobacteria bacterium]|nr:hypothetical protein [Gammaproteobacteria bacterium]